MIVAALSVSIAALCQPSVAHPSAVPLLPSPIYLSFFVSEYDFLNTFLVFYYLKIDFVGFMKEVKLRETKKQGRCGATVVLAGQ